MRILLADDEIELARGLKYILEKNMFTVDIVHNGRDAFEYAASGQYDGLVLDVMMPEIDGVDVINRLRAKNIKTPAMMLTAKSEVEDRVRGLEAGADDYLSKPFATAEFVARVKALVRRNEAYVSDRLVFSDTELDCSRYVILCRGEEEQLNNKEFQIAELFFRNPHHVFSAEHIMNRVWNEDSKADIDVVWTYIGFIRKKLKSLNAQIEIRTVRGAGYMLEGKIVK